MTLIETVINRESQLSKRGRSQISHSCRVEDVLTTVVLIQFRIITVQFRDTLIVKYYRNVEGVKCFIVIQYIYSRYINDIQYYTNYEIFSNTPTDRDEITLTKQYKTQFVNCSKIAKIN